MMSLFYSLLAQTSLDLDEVAALIAQHLGGTKNGMHIDSPTVRVVVTPPIEEEYLYGAEHATPTVSAGFYVNKDESLAGEYDTLAAAARTMVDCASAADLVYNDEQLVMRRADGVLILYHSGASYWDRPEVLERIPQPYQFSDERIIL